MLFTEPRGWELIKLGVLLSRSVPRLFRRSAPYPSREEKAVELTDALGRYVPAGEAVSVPGGRGWDGDHLSTDAFTTSTAVIRDRPVRPTFAFRTSRF